MSRPRPMHTSHRGPFTAHAVAQVVALALVGGVLAVAGCSDDGGGTDGGGSTGDFCADIAAFEAIQAEGDALFAGTGDDREAFRDVFGRFSAAIDAARRSVPDEIESDFRLVADTTQQLVDAFESVDYDVGALALDPQYAEVLVSLDDVHVTEANDRLAAYVRDRCAPAGTGSEP